MGLVAASPNQSYSHNPISKNPLILLPQKRGECAPRSAAVALGADRLLREHARVGRGELCQSLAQLFDRRPLGYLAQLGEQIIGQRHAFEGRARFEPLVQGIWDIADLDSLGHAAGKGAAPHMSTPREPEVVIPESA